MTKELLNKQAIMFALQARMAGMMAENEQRSVTGQSPAYGEKEFQQIEFELLNLAHEIMQL